MAAAIKTNSHVWLYQLFPLGAIVKHTDRLNVIVMIVVAPRVEIILIWPPRFVVGSNNYVHFIQSLDR